MEYSIIVRSQVTKVYQLAPIFPGPNVLTIITIVAQVFRDIKNILFLLKLPKTKYLYPHVHAYHFMNDF